MSWQSWRQVERTVPAEEGGSFLALALRAFLALTLRARQSREAGHADRVRVGTGAGCTFRRAEPGTDPLPGGLPPRLIRRLGRFRCVIRLVHRGRFVPSALLGLTDKLVAESDRLLRLARGDMLRISRILIKWRVSFYRSFRNLLMTAASSPGASTIGTWLAVGIT